MPKTEKKYYGVVEGFFSHPRRQWSALERTATLRFLTAFCPRINTYFYCPKEDPCVAARWSAPYSAGAHRALKKYVALCRAKGITFIYGLNPSFDLGGVTRDFDGYVDRIEKKLMQVARMGVTSFCILYDDIPYAYSVLAGETDGHETAIGALHAQILNELTRRMPRADFWFCPSDYFFQKHTPYIRAVAHALNPAVAVIWTGTGVFTKKITPAMLARARAVIGTKRRIILWDNYPVNDCEHTPGTFHIGAFNAPSPAAHRDLAGILINPMREAGANAIAYLTLEAYLKNPQSFDRTQAMDAAFRTLFGASGPAYARLYATFSDKNIADDVPRGMYRQLLEARNGEETRSAIDALNRDIADLSPPHKAPARGFVRTTASVITRAKSTAKIFSAMLADKPWEKQFLAADRFPVTLNKKYLTRQCAVLTTRIAYANAFGGGRSPSAQARERQLKTLRDLNLKYKNKNRLGITAADEKRLLRTLKVLIPLERGLFAQKIKALAGREKIRTFIRRSQINGY